MRQIKFRAWSVKEKCMLDWSTIKQSAFNDGDVNLMHNVLTSNDEMYNVMQFTGIYDKNGVEVYEHDIIKHGICDNFSCVKYEKGSFYLDTSVKSCIRHYALDFLEIIGNIHENQDLLK